MTDIIDTKDFKPPKMGRPPLFANQERISVTLDQSDKVRWTGYARAEGLSLSQWVIRQVKRGAQIE